MQKPSRTAYKVALNILALGAKPEMAGVLPPGIVEATAQLLIASGAASARTVGRYRSARMARVYEAFDWMMPGQFEAFAERKAFYSPTGDDGRPNAGPLTGLVLWLLKVGGEPWLWSIRPDELGPFLETVGWTSVPELESAAGKHGVEFYAVALKSESSQIEHGAERGTLKRAP